MRVLRNLAFQGLFGIHHAGMCNQKRCFFLQEAGLLVSLCCLDELSVCIVVQQKNLKCRKGTKREGCCMRNRCMHSSAESDETSEKEALLKLKAPRDSAGGSTECVIWIQRGS